MPQYLLYFLYFVERHGTWVTIVLGLVLAAIPLFIRLGGHIRSKNRVLNKYYQIAWKKSSSVRPQDILGIRGDPNGGFCPYYLARKEEGAVKEGIASRKNVLIIGNPLAGKSRLVYQALKDLKEIHMVTVPRVQSVAPEELPIPGHHSRNTRKILVLDDLDKFVEKENFMYLLQEHLRRQTTLVATCRSGEEYKMLRSRLERELSVLFAQVVHIPPISIEEAKAIAKQTGKDLPTTFDGNIGSIFLELDAMRERFDKCNSVEKGILRSVRRLYDSGIYREREVFSARRIDLVCKKKEGIAIREHERHTAFARLECQGFIRRKKKDEIVAEEAYLCSLVSHELSYLDNLAEMLPVFSSDPEALNSMGLRACRYGLSESTRQAEYFNVAIEAMVRSLDTWTLDSYPLGYAGSQNNLGVFYSQLGKIEQKTENCRKSIRAFQEALKIWTVNSYPLFHASALNNLATVFSGLAQAENPSVNGEIAVEMHQQALAIRTLERFPAQYADSQFNLGRTYIQLAEVKETVGNCRKAIEAYKEALKVWNRLQFSFQYSDAQTCLGEAFSMLGDFEDPLANCQRAVEACRESLKVRTIESFPKDYASNQNILGMAYGALAQVRDRAINCKRAIEAFREALKVRSLEQSPADYAVVQTNLANVFEMLASVEDKVANCGRAIAASQEALRVWSLGSTPIHWAKTYINLGNALNTLAEVEDRASNSKRAIDAYHEALKVFSSGQGPMDYAKLQNCLGNTYAKLAEVEDGARNCKRAIDAYQETLRLWTRARFPLKFALTCNNLGSAYSTLAELEDRGTNCCRAILTYREGLRAASATEAPEIHLLLETNLGTVLVACKEVDGGLASLF